MGDFDSPRHRLNQAVVSGKISGLVVGHVNPLERDSPLRANFNLVCDAGAGKVILVPCEAYGGLAKSLCLHDHKDGLVSLVAHVAPSGNIGLGRCLVAEAVSSPLKGLGPDTNQVILEGAVTALDLSPVGRADCFSLRMERDGKPFLVRCNVPGGGMRSFSEGDAVRVVGRMAPGMAVSVDYVERVVSRDNAKNEQSVKDLTRSRDDDGWGY